MTPQENDKQLVQFSEHLKERGFILEICGEDFYTLFGAWKAGEKSTPKRGMIVTGKIGCGKTHFLRALVPESRFVDCATPRGWETLESGEMLGDYMGQDIILDNFGQEPVKNDFGNKRLLAGELINARHGETNSAAFWKNETKVGRVYIATALNSMQICERYGHFTASRILALCIGVKMKGEGKREPGVRI